MLEKRFLLDGSLSVFSTDFESGAPPEFSGITNTESVQGYAGLGTDGNVFGGDFLRNDSGGPFGEAGSATTLTLTGLPAHTSIELNFLLAIIDSWDGIGCGNGAGPDAFNVLIDGSQVFSKVFENSFCGTQNYSPPPGVQLARRDLLGFSPDPVNWRDSAYNMGLDPVFDAIPHTAETLQIDWFADGPGWQGGEDESWGIDNVALILNGVLQPVEIDIKPGSDPNSVNLKSNGVLPVAILTTSLNDGDEADFDATTVDTATLALKFDDGGVLSDAISPLRTSFEDVDGDGDLDLVAHFSMRDIRSEISPDAEAVDAILTGKTLDGLDFLGIDLLRIVPPKKKT
jgi:hypothetical protein